MIRRSRLNVLDNFELASPCSVGWDSMIGNDQKRFCGQCNKNVYNLVNMEVDDIADLIIATEGKFCGRVYQRADGTLMTEDCPVGLAKVLRDAKKRTLRMALAAVTFACAGASLALFGTTTDFRVFGGDAIGTKVIEKIETTLTTIEPPPVPGGLRPIEMGDIAPTPPPALIGGAIGARAPELGKMVRAPRD